QGQQSYWQPRTVKGPNSRKKPTEYREKTKFETKKIISGWPAILDQFDPIIYRPSRIKFVNEKIFSTTEMILDTMVTIFFVAENIISAMTTRFSGMEKIFFVSGTSFFAAQMIFSAAEKAAGAVPAGLFVNTPGDWKHTGLFTSSRSIIVGNLIPGTTYVFQVR